MKNLHLSRSLLTTLVLIVGLLLLYAVFDIPGRFFYENRGWDIPADPQQKAAYDYAHALQIPRSAPAGGFRFDIPNPNFNKHKPVSKANSSTIEKTRAEFPHEPEPFNFPLARLRALIPGQPDVSTQYFNHLCETEAGDYIYRTAENVEGVYRMRPRGHRISDTPIDYDRYALEEPTGVGAGDDDLGNDGWAMVAEFVQPMVGTYLFTEQPVIDGPSGVIRYVRRVNNRPPPGYQNGVQSGYKGHQFRIPFEIVIEEDMHRRSRYGFTWRGIKREFDRRYSIGAGEYLIVDMDTDEVIAVKRAFKQSGYDRNTNSHIWWANARSCFGMHWNYAYFIKEVLHGPTDLNEQFIREHLPENLTYLLKETNQ